MYLWCSRGMIRTTERYDWRFQWFWGVTAHLGSAFYNHKRNRTHVFWWHNTIILELQYKLRMSICPLLLVQVKFCLLIAGLCPVTFVSGRKSRFIGLLGLCWYAKTRYKYKSGRFRARKSIRTYFVLYVPVHTINRTCVVDYSVVLSIYSSKHVLVFLLKTTNISGSFCFRLVFRALWLTVDSWSSVLAARSSAPVSKVWYDIHMMWYNMILAIRDVLLASSARNQRHEHNSDITHSLNS